MGQRHALDVLNRTTHPEVGGQALLQTAFELQAGEKPKIMGIMPLGCRVFAVKPLESVSKTRLEARAWVRSGRIPSAYKIVVHSLRRYDTTAEVCFDETLVPFRAPGD